LRDGRLPTITSGHAAQNPERPNHFGVDIFYLYNPAKDPPEPAADHHREGRWFVPAGMSARAFGPGKVVIAGDAPTGHRVWIDHGGGLFSGYFHLRTLAVAVGQEVLTATPLGEVGDSPTGPDGRHLHFELYIGNLNEYPHGTIDPQPVLATTDVADE